MDIDFLKSQSPKTKKGEKPGNFPIDYTKPNLLEAKKVELPKAKNRKIIPEKPPIKEKHKEKNKVSWWQKLKDKFKRKPKPAASAAPSFNMPQPVKKPDNKNEYQLAKEAKDKSPKHESRVQKGAVVTPSPVSHREALKSLAPKDLEKIQKGESSANFLDVNLIPEKLVAGLNLIAKIRRIIWAGIAALTVVLLVSGGMLLYQSYLINQVLQTQGEIKKVEDEINTYAPWQQEAVIFDNKVENVAKLLDRHIYWTAFFALLEQYTLPDVYYSNLTGDVSGTFTLAATAPDYETVSQQIALFKQADFISKVVVVSASGSSNTVANANTNTNANIQEVKFNISLTVKPEIFYYSEEL